MTSNPVVKIFSSLKLTLFTIFAIALTSIIGTVIPQDLPKSQYINHFKPATFKILDFFGIFDMYHSWWFLALLALLILNLIFCSLKHYKTTYNRVFKANPILTPAIEKTILNKKEFSIPVKKFKIEKVEEFLKKELSSKFEKNENNGEICYFVNKNKFADFGYYVVHASLIIIAIGAIIGSIWGFKGFLNIPVGDTKDTIFLKGGGVKNLGFKVKCLDFKIDFYKNGAPKEYRSKVEIIDNNKKFTQDIIVNKPLHYKGITFYQASYGTTGQEVVVTIKERKNMNTVFNGSVQVGVPVKTNNPDISFVIENYSNNFQGFGPTAKVVKLLKGRPVKAFYVFKKFPNFDVQNRNGEYIMFLENAKFKYYTGLQVGKDPGVNVVWFGCFLMIMGLWIAFFIFHKKFWIKIVKKDKKVNILFAGSMRKNKLNFEQEIDRKFSVLKEMVEKS